MRTAATCPVRVRISASNYLREDAVQQIVDPWIVRMHAEPDALGGGEDDNLHQHRHDAADRARLYRALRRALRFNKNTATLTAAVALTPTDLPAKRAEPQVTWTLPSRQSF